MKSIKTFVLLLTLFCSLSFFGQEPPEPPGSHGSNSDHGAGGQAPIAEGTAILLSFSLIYVIKKLAAAKNTKSLPG